MGSLIEMTRSASLAPAHATLDALLDRDLAPWSDDTLVAQWRELERLRNRLAAAEHAFVAEAERRGLPQAHGASSSAAFVRELLRVEPSEAKARVMAANATGPRWTLQGTPVEPEFPLVAAAEAAGTMSPAQARVITRTIQKLPDAVLDQAAAVEAQLVEHAEQFDANGLAKIAVRISAWLDPDGLLADHDYRQRHRELDLHVRADGSGVLHGELTAETTERLQCVFDALAAPSPAIDGAPDPRTAAQRRHDALLDVLDLAQRAEMLPAAGGVSTTVILTATAPDWTTGNGVTRTGHGALIPTREAKCWADGESRVIGVRLTGRGRLPIDPASNSVARASSISGLTTLQRIFTERQRLALIARDRGCSFPGCERPPQWCEAHHVIRWQDGGPTSTDNGTLLCGHHHRSFERLGWRCRMHGGIPEWIPPTWVDPLRRPRTNHAHV